MPLRIYNTLTRQTEVFTPRDPAEVTFYTCGPTVYDDAHIGNFRSFLAADLLRRWLESPLCEVGVAGEQERRAGSTSHRGEGDPEERAGSPSHRGESVHRGPRRVRHVMNITDVGHMTDDQALDGGGEDKMAAAGRRLSEAKKAGKLPAGVDVDPRDPRAIADFYAGRFIEDAKAVGLKVAMEGGEDGLEARPTEGGGRDAHLTGGAHGLEARATVGSESRPARMPRATDHIGDAAGTRGMTGVIRRLIERGHAYVVGEPGSRVVYFDVRTFDAYGSLSGNTIEQLRAGRGGRVSEENQAQKRHPADFLLWKEDASHIMKWPSPWGEGYPGWHIECTAMSVEELVGDVEGAGGTSRSSGGGAGEALIDIHSGGEDNIFPHHECEIAQSCCAFGDEKSAAGFAQLWFHPRFLLVDGEKMSKSKGNFFTVRQLLEAGHDPGAVRLELIKTHYRSNANFTEQGLKDSARMIERWRRFAEQAQAAAKAEGVGSESRPTQERLERIREHPAARAFAKEMHDDLNIAGALGALNAWINDTPQPTALDAEVLCEIEGVLGVLSLKREEAQQIDFAIFQPGVEPSDALLDRLRARRDARKARDFAAADAIRDEIAAMGYAVKDVAGGKVEVSRL